MRFPASTLQICNSLGGERICEVPSVRLIILILLIACEEEYDLNYPPVKEKAVLDLLENVYSGVKCKD